MRHLGLDDLEAGTPVSADDGRSGPATPAVRIIDGSDAAAKPAPSPLAAVAAELESSVSASFGSADVARGHPSGSPVASTAAEARQQHQQETSQTPDQWTLPSVASAEPMHDGPASSTRILRRAPSAFEAAGDARDVQLSRARSLSSSSTFLTTTAPQLQQQQQPMSISAATASAGHAESIQGRSAVLAVGLLNWGWSGLGKSSWGRELQTLLPLAMPVMIQSCLGQLLNIADLFFVGNYLGTEFLAAAALGNMYFNLLSALYMGAASAVDSACADAFAAGRYSAVGVLAQRGLFIMGCTAALVMLGLTGTGTMLHSVMKQERDLSATAAGFVDALLLGIFPYVASIGLSRYLGAQGLVWAPIAVDVLANIVNVSLNFALIEVDGFLGAPLATSLSRALQLGMLLVYLWVWKPHVTKGTWSGWNLKAAVGNGLGMMMMGKAAMIGSFVCMAESWPLELSNIIAGRLDVPSLDAHTVVLNTCLFISLGLPLGMSVAASARIPVLLSQGDGEGAHRTAIVSVCATVIYNLICALLLLAGRWSMGKVFTDSSEVASLCAAVAAVAALYQLVDGIQTAIGGVLRGLGYNRIVTATIFLGYSCVGLPAAAAFAFSLGLGISGLWAGMLCGVGSIAIAHMGMYLLVDWSKEADAARRRTLERITLAALSAATCNDDIDDGDGSSEPDGAGSLIHAAPPFTPAGHGSGGGAGGVGRLGSDAQTDPGDGSEMGDSAAASGGHDDANERGRLLDDPPPASIDRNPNKPETIGSALKLMLARGIDRISIGNGNGLFWSPDGGSSSARSNGNELAGGSIIIGAATPPHAGARAAAGPAPPPASASLRMRQAHALHGHKHLPAQTPASARRFPHGVGHAGTGNISSSGGVGAIDGEGERGRLGHHGQLLAHAAVSRSHASTLTNPPHRSTSYHGIIAHHHDERSAGIRRNSDGVVPVRLVLAS